MPREIVFSLIALGSGALVEHDVVFQDGTGNDASCNIGVSCKFPQRRSRLAFSISKDGQVVIVKSVESGCIRPGVFAFHLLLFSIIPLDLLKIPY